MKNILSLSLILLVTTGATGCSSTGFSQAMAEMSHQIEYMEAQKAYYRELQRQAQLRSIIYNASLSDANNFSDANNDYESTCQGKYCAIQQ